MFEFIRSHQRLMQFMLLLLILPSFVFFGIQSYTKSDDSTTAVAKLSGQTIQQQEFVAAQRKQTQQLQQQMGANFDPKLVESDEAKLQVLDNLIAERVTANEIARNHLVISNTQIQQAIADIPAVKSLFGSDGKLDTARYDLLLSSQGLTRDQFFNEVRRSLLLRQVVATIEESALVPKALLQRFTMIVTQQREVAELIFKQADYLPEVKLSDDAIQKYYAQEAKRYQIPEQVKVEYVVLDAAALSSQVTVSAEAIQEFYTQNKKRYGIDEQRRASHILIAVNKDASADDQQKAKAKAEDILKKVRANPKDFAKLAMEYSDDPGSKEKGGDLDYMGKGATVPPFEKALFELKENQISDVVQSDFGYHIIQLTGIRPAEIKPLEAVKGEIENEIRKQLVAKKVSDSAEAFSNMVYEQADSLQPAADKFGLKVQTASDVSRVAPPNADLKAPLSSPKLLTALFADDVLKNKHNTAAIEVAPNTLVAARVVEYHPASQRPLADVREEIKTQLSALEAAKLARQAGEARIAKLSQGANSEDKIIQDFSSPVLIGRGGAPGFKPEATTMIFKADVSKLPAYSGGELASGDYAVYRISKVESKPQIDTAQLATMQQSVERQYGEMETAIYLASLRNNAKVKLYEPYASFGKHAAADAGDEKKLQ